MHEQYAATTLNGTCRWLPSWLIYCPPHLTYLASVQVITQFCGSAPAATPLRRLYPRLLPSCSLLLLPRCLP
jgi:hypothetical protein